MTARDEMATGMPVEVGRRQHVIEDVERQTFRVHRNAYASSELLAREQQLIFDKAWLYVGHESEVPAPNRFVTRRVAGRPIIVTRSESMDVHVMINSCRHRGAEVCRAPHGTARAFKCFYHGWPYDLTGRLVGVPDRVSYPDSFATGDFNLARPPRVDSYRGFLFCSFDPEICDLPEYLGNSAEYLDLVADHSPAGMEVVGGTHSYGIEANWKLLVENSLDGYHLGPLHTTYFEFLVAQGDVVESRRQTEAYDLGRGHASIVDRAPWPRPTARWKPSLGDDVREAVEGRAHELHSRVGPERAERIANTDRNVLIFPNLVINDIMAVTIRVIWPISPSSMEVTGWALAPQDDTAELRKRTIQNFTSFLGPAGFATPDDIEALESVQRTMAARSEVSWSDMSRGMQTSSGHTSDQEVQARAFWKEWARRIDSVGEER